MEGVAEELRARPGVSVVGVWVWDHAGRRRRGCGRGGGVGQAGRKRCRWRERVSCVARVERKRLGCGRGGGVGHVGRVGVAGEEMWSGMRGPNFNTVLKISIRF